MRFSSFALAAFSLGSAFAAPAVQQTEPRALEILASVSTTIENTKAVVDVELKSLRKFHIPGWPFSQRTN